LYPEARGKGYMVRAVNLIQVYLKAKGVKRAVIRVNAENINSLRVPIACGFTKTGEVVTKKEGTLIKFVKEID
jgi:RimJ/RimL family protein N-acetyltransferase